MNWLVAFRGHNVWKEYLPLSTTITFNAIWCSHLQRPAGASLQGVSWLPALLSLRAACSWSATTGRVESIFVVSSSLSLLLSLSPSPLSQVQLVGLGDEGTPLCCKSLLALCQAPGWGPGLALSACFLVSLTLPLFVACHLGLSLGGSCCFMFPKLNYLSFT